ncbi:sigma-54 dependent transcriptional regulator [Psychrosphaera sp. 1_MG-2023]|uniref:sigma-54-dependent transcriptional regulator n=1 Tax=Psychrosphaera sp. 1_MG-2023 TaxID=3062643 RepID=UPI0026E3B332|nr:sigma-54 dependent transcriptional regulator [Psychrosphaera sp. 1_MG-2023]MDO6719902.1 sigma-54 dependent transcriptional regulator [Psychrosphaera sp. 1_MG-2023]
MADKSQILIIDDDEDILVAAKLLLRRHRFEVITCHEPEQIPELLKQNEFQVVMLDMNFGPGESSGQEGLKWLATIRQLVPDCVVVMITAHGGLNLAIEAMKLGATDFVIKPWQNEKLVATISSAANLGEVRSEAKQLQTTNQLLIKVANQTERPQILGNSAAMKSVMSIVARSAPTDANVLILGENGTGKQLVARELHLQSGRKNRIFMTVDLGAVSESLFESELFGHKKGAFTGANEDRIGKLEAAEGGTLFLDELGNLPLHLQAKLLTVLEQRQITPLGANKPKAFDVRVICATNASKQTLLDDTQFRQDLLFRLNTVEITLPALRERPEDIKPIAEYYAAFYCKKYGKPLLPITADVLRVLTAYPWPGNIRALRHAVERAVILSESAHLTVADFQLQSLPQTPTGSPTINTDIEGLVHGNENNNKLSASHNSVSGAERGPDFDAVSAKNVEDEIANGNNLNLEQIEKRTITQALRTYRYNISHTAKALGLTRAALYRRMEKHGL